jgi:hypothetical protein
LTEPTNPIRIGRVQASSFDLLDTGSSRLWPLLITVLVPLAAVITLILVPVFYSISVLDHRVIKWKTGS